MGKYRKKPIVIEALEWSGDNLLEIIKFTGQNTSASHLKWEDYERLVREEGLKIFNSEGTLKASIGDWIIKGVNGEVYPCPADVFEQTYEEVKNV